MGRLFFWLLLIGMAAGGYYIYTQDPDPTEARAVVNGTFASLHTRLNEAIAEARGGASDVAGELGDDEAGEESEDETATNGEPADDANREVVAAPQPALRGAVDEQTLDQYRAWISEARAIHPYPESEERMYEVMMCESRGQAAIVNSVGPYSGLFQYSSATWSGDWNSYRDQNILDPRAQIFATALAWSNGMQSHWGCYNRLH